MPELPEVETIKNDLNKKILKKKIREVVILKKGTVRGDARKFKNILRGNYFEDIGRIGKLLIFKIAPGDNFLLVHLKMTGQLIFRKKGKVIAGGHSQPEGDDFLPGKHTRVILKFSDDACLLFNDLRRFGYMQIVGEKELEDVLKNYGIEPLTKKFSLENFTEALDRRKISVKAVLLNQKIIAGIGNIYADEILFAAGIKPDRKVDSLSKKEILTIHNSAQKIIKQAIKYRGTTFNDYVDSDGNSGNFVKHLKVYGRAGKKCVRCGGIIKKIKLVGRGTHYCPDCQV